MSMYFYDDTDDWPEYKIIKDEIHRLEVALHDLRKQLQEVETVFLSDPTNGDLRTKAVGLEKKLKKIEKKLSESLSMYR